MKKSFKGFLACLLALIMVIPMFTVANADQMSTFNGTLQARETASVDVSRIRNSGIDMTADVAVKEQRNPEDIVTILVELEAAPAAEVCEEAQLLRCVQRFRIRRRISPHRRDQQARRCSCIR